MINKKVNFNIVGKFGTILADPPWEFKNKTGKIAPQYKKTSRYKTLSLEDIKSLPIERVSSKRSHLYLWVPNAFIKEGLEVMDAWGFKYKTNLIWRKIRKDGGPEGRGVGIYFRNTINHLSKRYSPTKITNRNFIIFNYNFNSLSITHNKLIY